MLHIIIMIITILSQYEFHSYTWLKQTTRVKMMINIVVVVQLSWTKAMKVNLPELLKNTRLRYIFITVNRHDNVWQQNGLRVVSIFVQNQHCLQCLLLLQSKNASHRCGFHINERNGNKNINNKNKYCKLFSFFVWPFCMFLFGENM